MNQLIGVYGKSDVIRIDNGPEMSSEKFIEWAKEQGIVLMFIQTSKPNQNAFGERFNRSFKDEVLNANLLNSVDQAQAAADDWVQDYNEFRPHEPLGDVAPMEFMHRKFVKEVFNFKLSTLQGSLRNYDYLQKISI
jgi:putative transposase